MALDAGLVRRFIGVVGGASAAYQIPDGPAGQGFVIRTGVVSSLDQANGFVLCTIAGGTTKVPVVPMNGFWPAVGQIVIVGVYGTSYFLLGNPPSSQPTLTGPSGKTIATTETTASTTYTNLTTVGPAVTVTTGTNALVFVGAGNANGTSPAFCFMSVAVSGATTLAASDTNAAQWLNINSANITSQTSYAVPISGLTAGSNTFTAKYRVSGGTGTFLNRSLIVIPLP